MIQELPPCLMKRGFWEKNGEIVCSLCWSCFPCYTHQPEPITVLAGYSTICSMNRGMSILTMEIHCWTRNRTRDHSNSNQELRSLSNPGANPSMVQYSPNFYFTYYTLAFISMGKSWGILIFCETTKVCC